MVKYCKNCGHELDDDSIFCSECGFNFNENTQKSYYSSEHSNPFNTYKIDMIDGEEIIRHSQIHKGCLYPPIILIGIGFVFGLLIDFIALATGFYYYSPLEFILPFFNIFVIFGIIWFIIRYIGYLQNDLILTNKRVFGKCGLISTTQMQSPLNKIDSVTFTNGIVGKIIGYGTVKISTASTHFKFRYISDGQTLYNDIFNQLEISQEENFTKQAEAIADAIKNS